MNQSLKGICFTVAGGCCWGMSGVMGKYLFDAKDLTATWLVIVRLLGAGICLLLLMYQRKGNSIFRVWKRKDSAVNQLIFGMIGMAMCQMTYFLAIQESNPGTAALFWGLLSAFAFAVYNVQPKKLLDEFGTLETTGWGMFVGGVLVTPFTKVWSVPGHWDIMTIAMTIGVVFLGTIVAFSCYLHGISMLGPVQGSMLGCVIRQILKVV